MMWRAICACPSGGVAAAAQIVFAVVAVQGQQALDVWRGEGWGQGGWAHGAGGRGNAGVEVTFAQRWEAEKQGWRNR